MPNNLQDSFISTMWKKTDSHDGCLDLFVRIQWKRFHLPLRDESLHKNQAMMWSGQLIPRAGSCFFWIYSSCHLLCYGLIIIIDKVLFLTARSIKGAVFSSQGIFPRAVTGYRSKGSMLVTIGVLLSSGSCPARRSLEKSHSKICSFHPEIIGLTTKLIRAIYEHWLGRLVGLHM